MSEEASVHPNNRNCYLDYPEAARMLAQAAVEQELWRESEEGKAVIERLVRGNDEQV
jgi:hypothetical protein